MTLRGKYTVRNYNQVTGRFMRDYRRLSEIEAEADSIFISILTATTKQELVSVKRKMQDFFSIPNSWKPFPDEYRFLKPKLDLVRTIHKALDERCHMLGIGEIKLPNPKSLYPTLYQLSQRYGIELFSSEKSNGNGSKRGNLEKRVETTMAVVVPPQTTPPPTTREVFVGKLPQKSKTRTPRVEGSVDLETLLRYYKSKGLVGEEKLAILQTLGAIHQLSFGIESLSGSGKSFTIEILISLLPKGDVYRMELSSKTAEMYNAETINRAKIIYIPELQKAMSSSNPIVVEVLKNITEGKDAVRRVRDQASKSVVNYTIQAGKGVIFTLATENAFKYDTEFSRRVFILHTDISKEQTDRILRSKARARHPTLQNQNLITPEEEEALKRHIAECLHTDGLVFENPFSDYISSYIPRTIRSRSYDDYYFDLVEAMALFHYNQRLNEDGVVFIELQDVYAIQELYWHQFCKSLLGIPLIGEEALTVFGEGIDATNSRTAEEVYRVLKPWNPSITYRMVENTLERLVEVGLLDKTDHQSRRTRYFRSGSTEIFDLEVDWQEAWNTGLKFMEEQYPRVVERWVTKQVKEGRVVAKHPLTSEVVELAMVKAKGERAEE
ncbi:hypothetical protein DRJ48_04435 [Candidatus Woesearchaeota archaeon]|nr:hypothetical protein [Candidatus Woesearchaeota archaeon]RLE42013.1 MAG: hypothetical protein DRJ48_04435 [Candidatus Woesearchaeota archaeon]